MDMSAPLRSASTSVKQNTEFVIVSCKDFARSPLGICHCLLAIYAGGFTMQIALLPYIVMELQQPVQTNGWILGMFSICQFAGAPLFGRLSDGLGSRNAFVLAMSSCSLMYIMMAVASSLPALFLSQLPGIMIHGTQAAMMVVALETSEQNRTAHLAYLNLSYGVGLVAGGVIGAAMANNVGPRGTLIVASALQLCGCFLAFLLGLDSLKSEIQRFGNVAANCSSKCLVMVVGLFPILMARYSFTPIAVNLYRRSHCKIERIGVLGEVHISFQPSQSNIIVTLIGASMIGILAPLLATRFGDRSCIKYSCPISLAGFILLTATGDIDSSLASTYICCTSQMTKLVHRQEIGSVLGLNASLFFLDAGASQLVGLPIYTAYGLRGFWLLCVAVTGLLAVYLFLIDKHTFKAFTAEDPRLFPLQSVYQSSNR